MATLFFQFFVWDAADREPPPCEGDIPRDLYPDIVPFGPFDDTTAKRFFDDQQTREEINNDGTNSTYAWDSTQNTLLFKVGIIM